MDALEYSLTRLDGAAHRLALLLESGNRAREFSTPAPERPTSMAEIPNIPAGSSREKNLIPRPSIYSAAWGAGEPASLPKRQEEIPLSAQWMDTSLYPPLPDSYREVSEQMLEDMRRRSTLPLDDVRTVIL